MSNNNTPSKLGFTIERRGEHRILVWPDAGCRPATEEECRLWDAFISGAPDAANAGEPARLPVAILDEEMAALRRFYETSEDGEDYDVPKGMMQRLALIGLVRRTSGSRYELTDFGSSVINGDFATPTGVAADTLLGSHLNYTRNHLPVAADESTRAPDGWARTEAELDAATREMDVIYGRWPKLKKESDEHRAIREELLAPLRARCTEIGMRRYALAAPPSGERPSAPAPEGEKR